MFSKSKHISFRKNAFELNAAGLVDRSNYFWGHNPLYTINGGYHEVAGKPTFEDFHKYTIEWYARNIAPYNLELMELYAVWNRGPERIQWFIDGNLVRTKERKETCGDDGVCKYPNLPS